MGMTIPDFFLCSFDELMILIHVYREKEKKQWYHTRMIAYCNMIATWQNPNKRPPSIDRYMKLEDGEGHSDEYIQESMQRLEALQAKYAEKVRLKKELIN